MFATPRSEYATMGLYGNSQKMVVDSIASAIITFFLGLMVLSLIYGQIDLYLTPLAFLFGGKIQGSMQGSTAGKTLPDLLNVTTTVLCRNQNHPEIITRVVFPSPAVSRQIIADLIAQLVPAYNEGSHTRAVLDQFVIQEEPWLQPISNQQLLNQIEADVHELAAEQRRAFAVTGVSPQNGLILATSVSLGGQTSVLLPSGFIRLFNRKLAAALGRQLEEPKLLAVA